MSRDSKISNKELLEKFKEVVASRECDFQIVIENAGSYTELFPGTIINFSIPQLGITFSNDSTSLSYIIPMINVPNLDISFIKESDKELDFFTRLHSKLFNSNGTLRFIPKSELPRIHFGLRLAGKSYQKIATFSGCKFGKCLPGHNASSSAVSVMRVSVSYSDYILY